MALAFAGALAMSACSVSTPRRGFTVAAVGGSRSAAAAKAGGTSSDAGGSRSAAATKAGGTSSAAAAANDVGGSPVGADNATGSVSGGTASGATNGARVSGGDAGRGVSVGVTDSTISISADGSFSGPYAAIYEQIYKTGPLTWRDEVNAHGGINGRKIEIQKVDDQFTVEGAVAACKAIQSNGSFAAFTGTLFDNGLACLNETGIPSLEDQISTPNPDGLGWGYIRSMYSSDGVGATLARYVASPQGLNRAGHKIGIIYLDDTPPVRAAAKSFIDASRQMGFQVHAEKITTNQPTFTAELQRMRDAGVDTIAMDCVFESVGIIRDAKAMAYKPLWTGYLFNADEVAAAGAAAFQGIKAPRTVVGADSAAFQRYKQTVAKYGETTIPPTTTDYTGYAALLVMQRALELAGRNLTRASYLAAYDQIQNLDTGGLSPVSYSPGHIVGTDATFPLVCCNPDNTWKSDGPSSDFR
ncbi:MAG: ABC transporter substrate-binding protein [Acidimicrobiales bacterium]